jgi:hypothetical protein
MEAKKTSTLMQYGLISALVGILFFVILYLGGSKLFTSPLAFAGYVLPIIFAVLACVKQKKNNGGFLEFKEALKIAFGVFVITALASTLVSYVILNFIDDGFRESLLQATIETTQKMMKRFGASDDMIDKQVQQMLQSNPFSFGKMILNFAWGCIIWFIFSLIIAAIVKKKKPEFPQPVINP